MGRAIAFAWRAWRRARTMILGDRSRTTAWAGRSRVSFQGFDGEFRAFVHTAAEVAPKSVVLVWSSPNRKLDGSRVAMSAALGRPYVYLPATDAGRWVDLGTMKATTGTGDFEFDILHWPSRKPATTVGDLALVRSVPDGGTEVLIGWKKQ